MITIASIDHGPLPVHVGFHILRDPFVAQAADHLPKWNLGFLGLAIYDVVAFAGGRNRICNYDGGAPPRRFCSFCFRV
jgi:hypothetical protein